ncbi:MAG: flagellar hook-length control protein FliK, partial [Pirellulales bacterium]|nr:flagellar hook-length control protein FliK [Pirellulales bacterium]
KPAPVAAVADAAPAPNATPPEQIARAEQATLRPTPPAAPVIEQVSVQIAKLAQAGGERIRINLSPASLGQVEVHMELGQNGRVEVVVRADRPETLDMLQRDARELVRALQDAGLKADTGGLNFQLGSGEQQRQADAAGPANGSGSGTGSEPEEQIAQIDHYRTVPEGRVDIRI